MLVRVTIFDVSLADAITLGNALKESKLAQNVMVGPNRSVNTVDLLGDAVNVTDLCDGAGSQEVQYVRAVQKFQNEHKVRLSVVFY